MTVDQLWHQLQAQRGEDLRSRDETVQRNTREHEGIHDQLKCANGTQRDHGVRIVGLEVEQQHHREELHSAKAERGSIWKRIRHSDMSRLKKTAYMAGAVAATTASLAAVAFILKLVIPLLKGALGG